MQKDELLKHVGRKNHLQSAQYALIRTCSW